MFDELGDGSIRQDGLRSKPRGDNPGDSIRLINYPVVGQVTAIYYVDDEENRNGETILCDVHITSLGIDLEKVLFCLGRASYDNYISFQPKPATKNFDKSAFNSKKINPKVTDADSVVVIFIDGIVHNPVIIAMLPHNQSGFEGVCPSPRMFSDNGDQLKIRMNGTNFTMDKDGNVTWENTNTADANIPKKKKFSIVLNEKNADGTAKGQKCEMVIDNTGAGLFTMSVTKENGKVQQFSIDAGANKVFLKTTTDDGKINSIEIDPAGIQLNVANGDLTENVSGSRTVNTKDQTFNITGNFIVTPTKKFTVSANQDVSITSAAKAKFFGDGGTDVGSDSSITNVKGQLVNLAGGGAPVARLGDMVVGVGNLGAPIVCNIAQGSPKVSAG